VVRFFPEFRRLHDLIAAGAIGQPALVRMSRSASFPRGSSDWHNDLQASGGVVLDMGIHDLDWLLWILGPAVRVYGCGLLNQARPFLDYGLLTIRMANGVMAHIESSWAEAEGFYVRGEISGDGGLLSYDSRDSTALQITHRVASGVIPASPGVNVPTTYTAESPYISQLRHVCRCVRGEEEPLIPAKQAVEALRLALAALESMATGEVVTL
jgi:UDP-N-acetylglucosamine 3-dehydrogenase